MSRGSSVFRCSRGQAIFCTLGENKPILFTENYFFKEALDSSDSNSYYFEAIPTQEDALFIEIEGSSYNAHWNDDVYNYFTNSDIRESPIKHYDEYKYRYLNFHFQSFKVYHFHDTSSLASLRNPCLIDDNLALREDGANLPAFLYRLKNRNLKSFRKIERIIQSVVPFFERFELNPDRLNPRRIKLEWLENQSEDYFNAHYFSDGTIRFIALVTLLMQPELPRIILIDEPELGLHPSAIKKLADIVREVSTETQVVLSTQSVALVDNFNPEDIITVGRERKQSVFSRLKESDLTDWLEGYGLGM